MLQKNRIYYTHYTSEIGANGTFCFRPSESTFYFRMLEYKKFTASTRIIGETWLHGRWCRTNLPMSIELYLVPLDRLTSLVLFGVINEGKEVSRARTT